MYGALWRILPGPAWVRILELLVLLAIVLFVLVEWIFPWLNTFVNVNDVTVEHMTRVLVIDNYDSFVYTLNGYLLQLGAETTVLRNDAFTAEEAADRLAEYDGVLLSPGPGTPAAAGVSIPLVHAALASGTPLLGVCLGHQAIAEALGATVTNAPEIMHGKTSLVTHDDSDFYLRCAAAVPRHPVPLARRGGCDGAGRTDRHLTHRERRDHGAAARELRRCSGCSSTRSRCSPRAAT